ncbi:hypothetical protein DFH09DRAFT_1108433 [Mycena vulgaris]|nr:hypothetical protein DFH09DRAFT_1108433 [Mycena vulgaris]
MRLMMEPEDGKIAEDSWIHSGVAEYQVPRDFDVAGADIGELLFWLAKVACARADWLVSGVGVDFGGITRPRPAFRLASHFVGLASHSAGLAPAKILQWLSLIAARTTPTNSFNSTQKYGLVALSVLLLELARVGRLNKGKYCGTTSVFIHIQSNTNMPPNPKKFVGSAPKSHDFWPT